MSAVEEVVNELAVTPRHVLPARFGVVTATDRNTFKGVQLLFRSLVGSHRVRCLLFDLGMTPRQLAWAQRQPGLYLMRVDLNRLPVPTQHVMWQTWNKPFYILQSPFRYTLWLDADTLVLGDLRPIVGLLEDGPFLTTNNRCNKNAPILYERLGIAPCEDEDFVVNAGVIGFDTRRDWHLMHEWGSLVHLAVHHPDNLVPHITLWDEGMLRVLIRRHRLAGIINPASRWNNLQVDAFTTMEELLEAVRGPFRPGGHTAILHLCGTRKPFKVHEEFDL